MQKDRIIEILKSWNFWGRKQQTGIPRNAYLDSIFKFIKTDKVVSIVGVRRSGKSTLMKQVAEKLISEGIPETDILIVNFEEPLLGIMDAGILSELVQAYKEIIRPAGKPFLFLDELQNVKDWEKFVRSANEKKEAFLTISGSSSKLLSRELSSVLTGRQIYFEIHPFSFSEFMESRKIFVTRRKDVVLHSEEIRTGFREYMRFGGFPEVVLSSDDDYKNRVLLSYYEDITGRDIIYRYALRKPAQIKELAGFYLANISSLISFRSVSRFLNLSVETARRFSLYIETADIIFFVKRFSASLKEQENSPRKVYSIDTGLANALGFRLSEDAGKMLENVVALHLRRQIAENPLMEMYYWKNHAGSREIDFVIKSGNTVTGLIQVCHDISGEKTKQREIKALTAGMDEFNLKEGLVLTCDFESEEEVGNKKIVYKPVWKWLLETTD